MEQQQQTKGVGKESQLSRIAAAVNPGSNTEANPESTKTMIQTFIKHFDSVALELIREMDSDQEDLVKNMVSEITKLQTKNIEEFQKAIGKIVGITNKMIESNNPKLEQLGQGLQDQAKEELFKAKGITLTGEKDTFMNRLGREFGMETEKEPVEKTRQGVGKIAKGFLSDAKTGFKAGLKESFMPQGGMLDRVFTTDEDKRQRELRNLEQDTGETESLADMFKKVIEQMLKDGKSVKPTEKPIEKLTDLTDDQKKRLEEQGIAPASENDFSYRKDGKPVGIRQINKALAPVSSEQQEDAAGISKDAQIVALEKSAESNLIIQENTTESLDIFKKMLELLEKIKEIIEVGGTNNSSGIMDGSFMPDIDIPLRPKRIGRTIGRAVRAVGRGLRSAGGTIARGGSAVLRGAGSILGFGTAAAGAAGVAGAGGAAGAAGAAGVAGAAGAAGVAGAAGATKSTGVIGKLSAKTSGIASKAGGVLAKGLGTVGRVAGKVALPLAAGLAAYDAYKGWNADDNATTGQKFKNAGRNVLSGLTFGLVDSTQDKMEKGEYQGTQKPAQGAIEKPKASSAFSQTMKENKGLMMGAALGPVGMVGGALYDASKKTAKPETGRNVDGAIIEAGTAATKDKMQVNVPPPTVINQGGGGGGQSGPTITAPGGVGNVRPDDPTWLMFQKRRAVA